MKILGCCLPKQAALLFKSLQNLKWLKCTDAQGYVSPIEFEFKYYQNKNVA
jgi:hypothetical protein